MAGAGGMGGGGCLCRMAGGGADIFVLITGEEKDKQNDFIEQGAVVIEDILVEKILPIMVVLYVFIQIFCLVKGC